MRTISAAAMQTLSQPYGVEPVTLIKVFWSTLQVILYGDRTVPPTVKGSILEISAFDDVVNFDGNKATQTFNVTLDDSDGSIKAIYDVHDIHKAKVQVFQWFSGIPLDDMFLIFQGEINSPIVWREGERSLTFAVVSEIEDQEVGFAPEEGAFDEIPNELVGKPFPLIFGLARNVPVLKLDPIPLGILLDALAVHDPTIIQKINALYLKYGQMSRVAVGDFYLALEAYFTAESPDGGQSFVSIGDSFVAAGNQALAQAWNILQQINQLTATLNTQKGFLPNSARVHQGGCFPKGTNASTSLKNGTQLNGTFDGGGNFQINGATHPFSDAPDFGEITPVPIQTSVQVSGNSTTNGDPVITKLGLVWEPSDQPFKLTSPLPVRYIACMLQCTVENVWAYRNYNDTRLLMQVPTEYYSVDYEDFGSMIITVVTLSMPLSYYDKSWDDSLYCDLQSSIGPNTVTILTWLIENYTVKGIDSVSFNHVADLIQGFPSNFALLREENIIKSLSDIAYQSRCALLLKNDVFYLKFLPEQPTPVATITLDDILVNTLELNHSSTENLITKLTATWVPSYEGISPNKVIVRNNTAKYGIHEQSVDWYIYTASGLVDLGASFWSIRKSNTWKLIKFKTALTKLVLESFDAVLINFATNWVCNGPVIGIVDSVKFNTKELNLEFEVWLPIRLGEMTQYNFAWPPDSDVDVDPDNLDFQKIGYDATGALGPTNGASNCNSSGSVKKGKKKHATRPTVNSSDADNSVLVAPAPGTLGSQGPNPPYDYNELGDLEEGDFAPQQGTFAATVLNVDSYPKYLVEMLNSTLTDDDGNPLSDVVNAFALDNAPKASEGDEGMVTVVVTTTTSGWRVRRTFVPTKGGQSTFPGQVVGNIDGNFYTVDLYENGTTQASTDTVAVQQLQLDPDDTIPNGTWVQVSTITSVNPTTGVPTTDYTMQIPIYL